MADGIFLLQAVRRAWAFNEAEDTGGTTPLAGTVPAWFHGVYGTPYWNSPPFRTAFRRRSSSVPSLPEQFRRFLLEHRRNAGLFQRAFRLRSGPVPDIPWTSQIASFRLPRPRGWHRVEGRDLLPKGHGRSKVHV